MQRKRHHLIIGFILSICLLLLAGCRAILPTIEILLQQQAQAPSEMAANPSTVTQPDLPAAWIGRMELGDPEAPIVVEAYEDFLCPHCRDWTDTVESQLMAQYIQAGTVRLVFHNFPLQGFAPGSHMAAMASQCAADQGLFWPYHDYLFAAQSSGQAGFMRESLSDYAKQVGADTTLFDSCLASLEHQEAIQQSVQEGIDRGVTGTPAVFVNGAQVANGFDEIQTAIEGLLAEEQ
ncbi:MAG TPA: DsbA family protein [Caldilineaceae bacterium]|nr:DsbA family protein [Caldilineaceae bacterium]